MSFNGPQPGCLAEIKSQIKAKQALNNYLG
jgi:hypothetical protein